MEFLATAEFWVAVSFVLFLGLVVYFGAHKKIAEALDARAARIGKELEEAKRLRVEAEKVLADYRQKQGDAHEDGHQRSTDAGFDVSRVDADPDESERDDGRNGDEEQDLEPIHHSRVGFEQAPPPAIVGAHWLAGAHRRHHASPQFVHEFFT